MMNTSKVYILHKNGAKSHYIGLKHLLDAHDITLKYREFSIFSKLFKFIFKLNLKGFGKQITNIFFFINLLFTSDKKIVLGIAPYDYKLKILLKFLKNHRIYYHTSWACWDKSFQPKEKKLNSSTLQTWKHFIEELAIYVFAVTESTKKSLLKNYDLDPSKINVVKHSVDRDFKTQKSEKKIAKSFIYIGRLRKDKGIEELIEIFSNQKDVSLTIIGKGELKEYVEKYSTNFDHIFYLNHINEKHKLSEVMKSKEFVVLNSKKTEKWEELFGMSLVEGMAHGLIPLAPNHPGPKEIVDPNCGYLFEEGKLKQCLDQILEEYPNCKSKQDFAKLKSKQFEPEFISKLWKPILD